MNEFSILRVNLTNKNYHITETFYLILLRNVSYKSMQLIAFIAVNFVQASQRALKSLHKRSLKAAKTELQPSKKNI